MSPTSTPPGWYPDPAGGTHQRYWDGQAWQDIPAAESTRTTDWGKRVNDARTKTKAFVSEHKEPATGFIARNKIPIAAGAVVVAALAGFASLGADSTGGEANEPAQSEAAGLPTQPEVDGPHPRDFNEDGLFQNGEYVCFYLDENGTDLGDFYDLAKEFRDDGHSVEETGWLIGGSVDRWCPEYTEAKSDAAAAMIDLGTPE